MIYGYINENIIGSKWLEPLRKSVDGKEAHAWPWPRATEPESEPPWARNPLWQALLGCHP